MVLRTVGRYRLGEYSGIVEEALDSELRRDAIWAAGRMNLRYLAREISRDLTHEDAENRVNAAEALARMGAVEVLPMIEKVRVEDDEYGAEQLRRRLQRAIRRLQALEKRESHRPWWDPRRWPHTAGRGVHKVWNAAGKATQGVTSLLDGLLD